MTAVSVALLHKDYQFSGEEIKVFPRYTYLETSAYHYPENTTSQTEPF